MGSNLSPHLCAEHNALWPSPACMTHSPEFKCRFTSMDRFVFMIKYPLDSSDKFRSEKKEEDKLFNYKQFSLANRTLNLSKSWTFEPCQDPHLLLLWDWRGC